MQYSDTTNKNGIIETAETLCLLGDTGISGNATLLKQFTGYINNAYNEIWMAIMSVDKQWKADDFNWTDLPDAPVTMVLSQSDYSLPVASVGANVATLLRVNGIYLIAGGVRTYLTPMDENDTLTTVVGIPTKYRLQGKSIFFQCPFSASALTLYGSVFYIEFQRIFNAFVSSDTTKQPGFLATYHDLVPLKASAWYMLPINPNLAAQYEQRFTARLELLKRDYANMNDDTPRRLSVRGQVRGNQTGIIGTTYSDSNR